MQLPLSASALVMLGVGAVLVGASILVVVLLRRPKPADGPTRIPSDMRRPQQAAATSGSYAANPAVDAPAARPPHVPPPFSGPAVPAPAQPVALPAAQTPEPAAPPPMEVSSRVEQAPPDRTPSAGMPAASSRPHAAGSGRTVAAAVAQAFAVRAAAGRGGPSGPGMQRPVEPPSPDDSAAPAEESAPARPDGDAGHVPAPDVDGVDPAAATDPDGLGLAAVAGHGPDDEPGAPEPAAVSGNGWVAAAAYGSNGDHSPDGNGQPPEGSQAPQPGSDGHGPAAAAGMGLLAAGWTMPASVRPDPEPAAVPTPRPDNDTVSYDTTSDGTVADDNSADDNSADGPAAQQDGSSSDARDRLLAVLLDDPERAVGAAVELETCLRELDRLSDAVRTGRAALRDVLQRLASAGLRPDQLARLAGMPLAEVEALFEPAPAEQQA